MKLMIIPLLFFTAFSLYARDIEINLKQKGEFIEVSIINYSERDVQVFENLAINSCAFRNGLCIKDYTSDNEVYSGHGAILQKKKPLKAKEMLGWLISHQFSPFGSDGYVDFVPEKVSFIYYGPDGLILESPHCEVFEVGEGLNFEC